MKATHEIKLAIYDKPFRAYKDADGFWQAENGTIINTAEHWVEWSRPIDQGAVCEVIGNA